MALVVLDLGKFVRLTVTSILQILLLDENLLLVRHDWTKLPVQLSNYDQTNKSYYRGTVCMMQVTSIWSTDLKVETF